MIKTLETLVTRALEDGGATAYLNDKRERYVVGGVRSHWVHAEYALAGLENAARQLSGVQGADTLGSWYDGDTGMIWLDYGTVHHELGTALAIARERGELAIWDTETDTEIRVQSFNQLDANAVLDAGRIK